MITFIISALKIIFLLGFLILIHEAGHLIVAKLCKVKVNEFAIGFGPTIFSKQGPETKYALRLIPLGGFCSMEGEEERSETKGSFSEASIPKRIAIVLAGATVNIIFGLLVYFILMASTGNYVTNIVDNSLDGYVAQQIGLETGDKIVQIDNKKINNRYDLNNILEKGNGEEIQIKVARNGEILKYTVTPTEVKNKYTGMYLDEKCKIVTVDKDSPAEKQGIQANDKIIKINDEEINGDVNKALEIIHQKGIGTMLLTIERGKEEVKIEVTPDYVSSYYLGVTLKPAEDTFINHIIYAGIETKEFSFSIVDNIKSLFSGKVGVTNLLPIPALDGGKILILIIEAIRRKPMKQETEINIQLLGFSILIALSLYITYHDIVRIF